MSIIDSDGLNTNFQLNVLKGLQQNQDVLKNIAQNTLGGGSTFDGQLSQEGNNVSTTNPLPVKGGVADTTFQDSTGQLFVYRDNGIDTPIAYKIPEWTVYIPVGAVAATSSPLTNYSLETGGNLASINTKTPALVGGKVPVTNPTALPLPTGAATEDKQTESITQILKVVKNTTEFYTENVQEDTATATTYVGKQSIEGQWLIQKIVDIVVGTVTTTNLQYATIVNNTLVLDYTSAWADRATLTYSEIKNLL